MTDEKECWHNLFNQLYDKLIAELRQGEALVRVDFGYSHDGKRIAISDADYNSIISYLRQSLMWKFSQSSYFQETEKSRIAWRINDKTRLVGARLSCSLKMAIAGQERYKTRLHVITNNLANLYNLRPLTKPFVFRGDGNLLIGQNPKPFTIYFNEINKKNNE